MKFIMPLQLYVENIDEKKFIRYITIFLVILGLGISFLIYTYYSSISAIQEEITSYQILQEHTEDLIQQYALVQKQKEQVEAILAQEKGFKINQYFYDLLQKLSITYTKEQEAPIVEDAIEGYQELRLDVVLENINLKQLCELLERLEKKDRIYIKEVIIEKNETKPTINVRIVIATLAKKELNEILE